MPIPGPLASTSALREVGGFEPRLYLCGDWMMWLRLSLRIRSVYVPEPGILYRQAQRERDEHPRTRRAGAPPSQRSSSPPCEAAYRDPAFPADRQWTLRDHLITILSDQAFSHLASPGPRARAEAACGRPYAARVRRAPARSRTRFARRAGSSTWCEAAELLLTRLPASVVAAPEPTVDDVTASLQALRRLVAAPRLVGRVQVAARGENADALIALIEDDLARNGDVDGLQAFRHPRPALASSARATSSAAQLDDERSGRCRGSSAARRFARSRTAGSPRQDDLRAARIRLLAACVDRGSARALRSTVPR